MTDLYLEDYGSKEKDNICWQTIGVLCVVIIGFVLFYMIYTSLWELMLPAITDHGLELTSLGLIFGVLLVVYIVRSRSLEKRKIMAAS